MLLKFQVLEIKRQGNPNTLFSKSEGWQFAPLHWVFAVKHGGRHKARLLIGGHVTDASEMETYAATFRTEDVRLQFF